MAFGVGSPRRAAVGLVLVAAAFATPSALADNQPPPVPPPNSGISEYVEQVPSSGGAKAPGINRRKQTRLSSKVRTKLTHEGGSDAPLLNEIATSSDLGAPTHIRRSYARKAARTTTLVDPSSRKPGTVQNLVVARAPTDEGGTSRAPVFVALGVALAATAALGLWRFRTHGAGLGTD